jgi:hypothetical protein
VVAGVSQGGHAALVTNERAAERLPDADLLGAVALAPGSQLGQTFGDDIQARVITTMVLVGVAAEDPDVELSHYLSPEALEVASTIQKGCVNQIIETVGPIAAAPDFFEIDPRTDPVGIDWVEQNDPGQVASDSPLLLAQGGQDSLVLPARTAALFDRLCGLGQVVDLLEVPTATHDSVTGEAAEYVTTWIADRFAGKPATDDC